MQIGAIVAIGLPMGLVAFHIYRLGVFLLCTGIGATAASVVLQPQDSLKFLICLVIGVLLGFLGMAFVKPTVILSTSLGGGFSIASALAAILKREGEMKILILGTALFAAGIVVQALSAKNQEEMEEES